ncbi:MAG: glycoside hydrolase family 9 protein [Promethearchaeota archaeon]
MSHKNPKKAELNKDRAINTNENTRLKTNNPTTIFKSIKRSIKKYKEATITLTIIFSLLFINLGVYIHFKNIKNDRIITMPQLGYYLSGSKIAHFGIREPLSDTPVMILNKDNQMIYYTTLIDKGWYNNYHFYEINFSGLTEINTPINVSLYIYTAHRNTYSHEFRIYTDPYNETGLKTLLTFLNVQKCGVKIEDFHEACHLSDGQDIGKNLSGGWHDAGDYNKYSYNTAYTIYTLLDAYNLSKNELDEDNNSIPDILDEAIWGLNWLIKMQDSDGGVYNKISSGFSYHGLPENEDSIRTTYTDKYTGTAAAFSASLAFASIILKPFNVSYSNQLLSASERAFDWLINHPIIFQNWSFGEYPGDNYSIGWAASELYRATNNNSYLNYAINYLTQPYPRSPYISGWNDVALLGLYTLMNKLERNSSLYNESLQFLIENSEIIRKNLCQNPFEIPIVNQTEWGVNGKILNHFRDSYYLYLFTSNKTYLKYALRDFNWIIGDNPWQKSFISDLGYNNVVHPYTQYNKAIPGGVVPGPVFISNNQSEFIESTNCGVKKCYTYNEYTINTNAETILAYTLISKAEIFGGI